MVYNQKSATPKKGALMKKYPVLCLLLLSLTLSACGGGGGGGSGVGSSIGLTPDSGNNNESNTGNNSGNNDSGNNSNENSGSSGGESGNIPSTLPEITSTDGTTITAMPYAVNTEAEATQLVQNSLDSDFYSQNGVSLSSVQFQDEKQGCANKNECNKNECNKVAFGRMKKYLIDQDFKQLSSADPDELRDALLLVGYTELPNNCKKDHRNNCTLAHLISGLDETTFNELKEKARISR